MKFKLITDAGHGWLEVKKALLKDLGIENSITAYSYEKGDNAYLEEDCDLSTFISAWESKGHKFEYESFNYSDYSPIRNYSQYKGA